MVERDGQPVSIGRRTPGCRETGERLPDEEETLRASNLTTSQFLVWMGQKIHPDVPLYNMVLTFAISGGVRVPAFRRAFQTLLDRCEDLRTVVDEVNDVPRVRQRDRFRYEVEYIDLSAADDPRARLEEWLDGRRRRCFDLGSCLFDSVLLGLGPESFVWYFNQHHLITDGWSAALVYRRMAELYGLAIEGRDSEAAKLPSFRDYAMYERARRGTPAHEKAVRYWREKSDATLEPAVFYDASPTGVSVRTHRLRCELGVERTARLKSIASEPGVRSLTPDLTLFNIFSTLLFSCLYRVGGQRDLALATPAHNRATADFKNTVGLFMELFPLRVRLEDRETFSGLLQKVVKESREVLLHARPGTGSAAHNKALNVVLNFIHSSFTDFAGLPMRSEWVHSGYGDPGHSLRLQVHDFDSTGSLLLHFDLNEDVFPDERRPWIVRHFLLLLDAFLEDRDQVIDSVGLLTDEEREVLAEFNDTAVPLAGELTMEQLVQQQVERTPDAIALRHGDETLTYRELDRRANRLARRLQRSGVVPGVLVGICVERSVEMVVGILGILKAGGGYVPLDPAYPRGRLSFMLADAGTPVLLTRSELLEKLPGDAGEIICLDRDWPAIERESAESPRSGATPEHPAYVIYTSGSTGTPKGVVIPHGALVNYVTWAGKQYLDGEALDFALFSSFSFDLTVTSIFVPLASGGGIVVYDHGGDRDLSVLEVFKQDAVDVVKLTPSHLALVRDMNLAPSRLKKLIVGGEDLKRDLARDVDELFQGRVEIYNEYGPTEATVGCMIHRFDPLVDLESSVPIGGPIDNVQIFLLDRDRQPRPVGMVGEICVSGRGLAKSYLNRPDLTEERFVENPLVPGTTIYRTGDLARWTSPGKLRFLGRADDQVKIRGARIELGEVESALRSHPAVRECAVDVVHGSADRSTATVTFCIRCGLPSNFPGCSLDEGGVCGLCLEYDRDRKEADRYFQTMDDLRAILESARETRRGEYDCLALLSGGKDSTYALYRLVDMGLKVFAFSFDNGYISDGAKDNIRKVVSDLAVDHVFATTPAMNAIFADSLKRYSNVCNGCFKTIYTLSANVAREKGIRYIVTGLSRGQIFETRLSDLFRNGILDVETIDRTVLEARKAYHRMDDVVAATLDVDIFKSDRTFEEIQFIDFYRYCDAGLDEMLTFLDRRAPWVRPADTGRSTNCLINDAGIYVHKRERGYHNYALPYSWDVRLGHKTRDAAIEELNDDIDVESVERMLGEVGYRGSRDDEDDRARESRLVGYYVAGEELTGSDLRAHLVGSLPDFMVPAYFVRLDSLPLTAHGKVDRERLPGPGGARPSLKTSYAAPRTRSEKILATLWEEVLGIDGVGVHDNFIELGGDSIHNIHIVAKANRSGLELTPKQLFDHPTISGLAAVATTPHEDAWGPASGWAGSTPIQSASSSDSAAGFPLAGLDEQGLSDLSKLLEEADRSESPQE